MNVYTIVELLALYLRQSYNAHLNFVYTTESKLGFSYEVINFTHKNKVYEIKVFTPNLIIVKQADFLGKVSANIVDARKEIDNILNY